MTLNNHDYESFVRRVQRSNTAHKTVQAFIVADCRNGQAPSRIPSLAIDTANGQWARHLGIANAHWVIGPKKEWSCRLYFVTMVWGRSPQLGEPPQPHYGDAALRSSGHHNHPCRNSGPTDSVGPHKPSLSMENWLHNLIVN